MYRGTAGSRELCEFTSEFDVILELGRDFIAEQDFTGTDAENGKQGVDYYAPEVHFFPCTIEGSGLDKLASYRNDPRYTDPNGTKEIAKHVQRRSGTKTAKAPKVKTSPKRAAKRDLARRAAIALGSIIENSDGSEAFLAGMSKEEAAQVLANWIHHLPLDGEMPGTLPKPDRSDWK
jgi:hypothetical protein